MRAALLLLCVGLAAPPGHAALTRWPVERVPAKPMIVLDTRALGECLRASVAGARCLPASEFFDARGRLAPWREIVWLFSTAGLTGRESVVVTGADARERHVVAGLLELCGQRHVAIAEGDFTRLRAAGWPAGTGRARDFARQVAYTAALREGMIVLAHERHGASASDVREALHRWVEARLAGRKVAFYAGNTP